MRTQKARPGNRLLHAARDGGDQLLLAGARRPRCGRSRAASAPRAPARRAPRPRRPASRASASRRRATTATVWPRRVTVSVTGWPSCSATSTSSARPSSGTSSSAGSMKSFSERPRSSLRAAEHLEGRVGGDDAQVQVAQRRGRVDHVEEGLEGVGRRRRSRRRAARSRLTLHGRPPCRGRRSAWCPRTTWSRSG